MKVKSGAFVTLKEKGDLRGCIGRFISDEPLYKVVQEMAIASSTEDTRFPRVESKEIDELEIEISVLSPMKKIHSIDEIELGKHGIYIKKGYYSGTFLPQVATETGWTKEEFLGHCARDKAGIGWDGWKDAEIYTYEADVFSEKEINARKD
jgi:AmmeMemoRadiSam system protein A